MQRLTTAMALLLIWPLSALAGEADIVNVKITKQEARRYTFSVTVRHADTGWKHYANKWVVVAPDGAVLGTRTLLHPHEEEQPFTRSLYDVNVPSGIDSVTVRAHDIVHGYGGVEKRVTLP